MLVDRPAALVRSAIVTESRAFGAVNADVMLTLRHLLACPSMRDVAVKASRLKSLATCAIGAVPPMMNEG
jgi:hypothetical protein